MDSWNDLQRITNEIVVVILIVYNEKIPNFIPPSLQLKLFKLVLQKKRIHECQNQRIQKGWNGIVGFSYCELSLPWWSLLDVCRIQHTSTLRWDSDWHSTLCDL
jgi:hypothetical protein